MQLFLILPQVLRDKNSYHNFTDEEAGALRDEVTIRHGSESTSPSSLPFVCC